jgi:hypothetical protein
MPRPVKLTLIDIEDVRILPGLSPPAGSLLPLGMLMIELRVGATYLQEEKENVEST